MRPALLVATLLAVGCGTTTTTPDLSVIPAGCRPPSGCWSNSCACTRDSVTGAMPSCLACDPAAQSNTTCDCTMFAGTTCEEPAVVCVGRGPVCTGVGAKCVPPLVKKDGGLTDPCEQDGDPPEMVPIGSDASPASEPRCAFVDDVCCPGAAVDLGAPDANLDQSVRD